MFQFIAFLAAQGCDIGVAFGIFFTWWTGGLQTTLYLWIVVANTILIFFYLSYSNLFLMKILQKRRGELQQQYLQKLHELDLEMKNLTVENIHLKAKIAVCCPFHRCNSS